jgi:hypothetical protein
MNNYDPSQIQTISISLSPDDAIDPNLQTAPSERHSGPEPDTIVRMPKVFASFMRRQDANCRPT